MELPYITEGLPGIGGEIKTEPQDFRVTELPLYGPSGQGEHVYITLTRAGLTTRQVICELARVGQIKESGVGYAGLKDKEAVTTQTFSLHLTPLGPEELAAKVADELGHEVHGCERHTNKLRRGHLLGNRFEVLIRGVDASAAEPAREVAGMLAQKGLANFFGSQRFGREGDNAVRGRELVLTGRGPRKRFLRDMLLSAWQSELFNRWLAERLAAGSFQSILAGDVCKKLDTGGMFVAEDSDTEQPRLDAWEITYTGPIFGHKMRAAQDRAAEIEAAMLEAEGADARLLKKARLPGSRRPARLPLPDLTVRTEDEGLLLDFSLPKGSYATVVLREVMKN